MAVAFEEGAEVDQVVVRRAAEEDRAAVLGVIALAFAADPVARWFFPEALGYPETLRRFAEAFAGGAFGAGTAQCVEGREGEGIRGAALWLPPGVGADEVGIMEAVERGTPKERMNHVLELMEKMGQAHPHEPHWHLAMLGVDPARQRRGLGAAMLSEMTQRLDREGALAYLESSNPMNIPLYERHGFERRGIIRVGRWAPIYPMVREPR